MKIGKYILRFILHFFAILPFGLIYVFSDFTAFILMYVIRYRRTVVINNLKKSFPEKDQKELKQIEKKFYRNLSDLIFEINKASQISIGAFNNRFKINNLDIINNHIKNGKSVITCLGHRGNWEWMGMIISTMFTNNGYAVYKPQSNVFFNDYVNSIRSRFSKDILIPLKETSRKFLKNRNIPSIYLLIADQSPAKTEIEYEATFLNQKTPVYLGVERLSKAFDFPVVFIDIIRVKRGYYQANIKELFDKPKDTTPFEITNTYLKILEDDIRKQPDNWLWSHRRWKYASTKNS